ncbi:hypothetical protein KCU98_g13039, partial [Aureobasidium melanogenum]
MPKGKRSARASWLFRNKPAVASAHHTFGRFNVSINHDETKAEGSIVIQHAVHLEGFSSEQTLDLVLRPESIIACELNLDNQNHRLPPKVLNLIPTNRGDIWSLSLTMHTPGTVICPTTRLPLSFVSTSFGQQFAAYSHLCQATQLRIYLGKDQFQSEHRARLERFACAIVQRRLRANPIDLRSLGGGGGKQETTWDHIHPPPVEQQQADFGASRKRSRVDSNSQQQSGEPSTKIQKFFWDMVPPGSPTEVNTPSSRHVTPTLTTVNTLDAKLIHPFISPTTDRGSGDRGSDEPCQSRTGQSTNARHNEERRPGSRAYTPLPAYPAVLENTCTPSPALEKTSSPAWGSSIEMKPTFLPQPANNCSALPPELTQVLGGMLQQLLPNIIEGAFTSILAPLIDTRLEALVTHKMETLVQEKLPQFTQHALQQKMDRFIDDLEDGHKRAEVEIGETVAEGKTELNEARDRSIDDIETWAQERFEDFEGEVVGITKKSYINARMKATTIFTTLAAALPAFAVPHARSTGDSFGGLAIHSGSPVHLSAINANGNSFWLNKETSSYCPNITVTSCPEGKYTYFEGGNNTLSLNVEVPGGQRVYVAQDGSLGYTIPHGSVSGSQNVSYTGFNLRDSGIHLQYKGADWIAVPIGSAYKVYAAAAENAPQNGTSFAFRVGSVNATFGAWEYL